jgi:hypothetical protein
MTTSFFIFMIVVSIITTIAEGRLISEKYFASGSNLKSTIPKGVNSKCTLLKRGRQYSYSPCSLA